MMKEKKSAEEKLRGKKAKIVVPVVSALLVLIVLVLFLFHGCSADMESDGSGLMYDTGVVEGGWEEADKDEIVDSLNKKVEEGMINISMNTSPVFKDGKSNGNLMIVNDKQNNYPQIVEITRNDTGELIYASDGIPVGSKIEKDKLDVDLPAGTYECTAMFHNMDPETGDSLGCAGAVIMITVQE